MEERNETFYYVRKEHSWQRDHKCKGPGAGTSLSCSRPAGRLVWPELRVQVEDEKEK